MSPLLTRARGAGLIAGLILCPALLLGQEAPSADVRFAAAGSALDIPFEPSDNLIFVQGRVNGSEPAWFILDTGATMTVLDTSHAETWGLDLSEKRKSPRTGMEYVQVNGVRFGFPGVEFLNQPAGVMNLGELAMFAGRTIAGILGYDLISRVVLKIDYASRTLSVFDPATFKDQGVGERVPLTVTGKWPLIDVRLEQPGREPREGKVILDTGSLMALSLMKGDLAEKTIPNPVGMGISGVSSGGRLGRVETVRIGGLAVRNPVAGFPGEAADEGRPDPLAEAIGQAGLGIIGSDLLHRFTLTFDYPDGTLWMRPNRDFDRPFEYDMSGMTLIAAGASFKTFIVFRVMPGSPAAEAGVKEKDVITAVDGRPAAELTLAGLREMLKQEGRRATLKIQRGEEALEVSFVLRRLI
jgi:hypothetical protein